MGQEDGRGGWEAHFFRSLCQTGAHLKEKNRGSRREVALEESQHRLCKARSAHRPLAQITLVSLKGELV